MKGNVCGLLLCCCSFLAQAHETVVRVLRSSNAAATEKFMQGLAIYTSPAEFSEAAGSPEWCVDFEYLTEDSQFRTSGVSVQDSNQEFTPITLQQDDTDGDVSPFVNYIKGIQPPKRATMFVNNNGGGAADVSVSMNINFPVVSWRATFIGIQDNPSFPSDGLKLTLVLQTPSTSVSVNTISDGFFGFTVAETEKVQLIRFEGDQNVEGGETFEMDNICGSATVFVASESPSAMPSLPPTQSPTQSPVPDPEPECFAKDIFIIGPIICFILDIFSFIF